MSDAAFIYSEKLIADRLGLSRTSVRELRNLHLEESADWKKIDGTILLSSKGAFRMAKLVEQQMVPDLESCVFGWPKKNGAPTKLIVVKRCLNPRMVFANESGDAGREHQLVDVGNNKKIALGDLLEVAPHDAQAGVWQLKSKLPRTDRRPAIQGTLRSPENWGQREMNKIVERERQASLQRLRKAGK